MQQNSSNPPQFNPVWESPIIARSVNLSGALQSPANCAPDDVYLGTAYVRDPIWSPMDLNNLMISSSITIQPRVKLLNLLNQMRPKSYLNPSPNDPKWNQLSARTQDCLQWRPSQIWVPIQLRLFPWTVLIYLSCYILILFQLHPFI